MNQAIESALRTAKAPGGGFHARKARIPKLKLHVGPVHSAVAGRTDHLPVHVQNGSYVLPADNVSALGEGSTLAGFKVLRRVFGGMPYGGGSTPYGQSGGPYGEPLPHAEGGEVHDDNAAVPVVIAGGEMVLSPAQVRMVGDGDLEMGHRVLDEFVKRLRAETIKTLKNLPGPKTD